MPKVIIFGSYCLDWSDLTCLCLDYSVCVAMVVADFCSSFFLWNGIASELSLSKSISSFVECGLDLLVYTDLLAITGNMHVAKLLLKMIVLVFFLRFSFMWLFMSFLWNYFDLMMLLFLVHFLNALFYCSCVQVVLEFLGGDIYEQSRW